MGRLLRSRFVFALSVCVLSGVTTACARLTEGQSQTIFVPTSNGVEAQQVYTGASEENPKGVEGCLGFQASDSMRCRSEQIEAKRLSWREATLSEAENDIGTCSDRKQVLEVLFDTQVSTCSESAYQIARGDQIIIAVDLIIREEECQGDPCAPFGLIDPIEIILNNFEIAADEDPQITSMKANVDVTEVTVDDAVFYIINSVEETG